MLNYVLVNVICAQFSPQLAHCTKGLCFIKQLFRFFGILFYFYSQTVLWGLYVIQSSLYPYNYIDVVCFIYPCYVKLRLLKRKR